MPMFTGRLGRVVDAEVYGMKKHLFLSRSDRFFVCLFDGPHLKVSG